jgi:hypothetical protein
VLATTGDLRFIAKALRPDALISNKSVEQLEALLSGRPGS